jgi:hypothetical protein
MRLKVCHDGFQLTHPHVHGPQETQKVTNVGRYTEEGEH